MLLDILKAIYRRPSIIPLVVLVFGVSTTAVVVAVLIPISLLEGPLLNELLVIGVGTGQSMIFVSFSGAD